MGEVLDEPTVEIGKAKEGLNLLVGRDHQQIRVILVWPGQIDNVWRR
jgi:hypothetical protein